MPRKLGTTARSTCRALRIPVARVYAPGGACKSPMPVVSLNAGGQEPLSRHDSTLPNLNLDRSATLDALYRDHRDVVVRYVQRHFGSGPPDPADVVQSAFEKFAALENFTDIGNPRSFLMASARNCALDQRRRLKVRRDYAEEKRAIETDHDDFDPERVLLAKQQWALLQDAIQRLDARRREVLIMNRVQGLSSAEIARRLGCSATLVKTMLAQALVFCQKALREDLR